MDLQLQNKTALVTGATAGIGLAIALELAREGAAVTITGRQHANGRCRASRFPSADHYDGKRICTRLQKLADKQNARLLQRFFKTGSGQYGEGDKTCIIHVASKRRLQVWSQ